MCSSLSMTQGPAINANGAELPISSPDVIRTRGLFHRISTLGESAPCRFLVAVHQGRADECPEQRVRLQRLRLEFGMELAAQVPGMIRQFADFYVNTIGSLACETQSMLLQHGFVLAVEFVAMPMPLTDLTGAVGFARETVFSQ